MFLENSVIFVSVTWFLTKTGIWLASSWTFSAKTWIWKQPNMRVAAMRSMVWPSSRGLFLSRELTCAFSRGFNLLTCLIGAAEMVLLKELTFLSKALLPQSLRWNWEPAQGTVLVAPNVFHLRMMEATLLSGNFMMQTFFCNFPQIWALIQSGLEGL